MCHQTIACFNVNIVILIIFRFSLYLYACCLWLINTPNMRNCSYDILKTSYYAVIYQILWKQFFFFCPQKPRLHWITHAMILSRCFPTESVFAGIDIYLHKLIYFWTIFILLKTAAHFFFRKTIPIFMSITLSQFWISIYIWISSDNSSKLLM